MAEVRSLSPAAAWVRAPTKSNSFISYAHGDQEDNPGQETDGLMVSSMNCDRC